MNLHLVPVSDGYFVEEDETFRLLAHDPAAPVAWGFTYNSDFAYLFPTADEALEMGRMWDPTMSAEVAR